MTFDDVNLQISATSITRCICVWRDETKIIISNLIRYDYIVQDYKHFDVALWLPRQPLKTQQRQLLLIKTIDVNGVTVGSVGVTVIDRGEGQVEQPQGYVHITPTYPLALANKPIFVVEIL